jgi:hypothetical protein
MPQNENLTVDLSDGPNPIMTACLRRTAPGGYVREVYGLGYAELVRSPAVDIVHDPAPPAPWFEVAHHRLQPTGTILQGLVSATPTGSINLKLRLPK